jgi:hypothetical protein
MDNTLLLGLAVAMVPIWGVALFLRWVQVALSA